ncbi:DUF2161 domain-containing phosphodiesterase [Cohnella silvisoli]|uniref:DUF2161 family putative PD-(D/E)XK-type phosphodiesterase n=1 Tax=Cohnella silvisoli TaxID=2873699 RepID=A0ABV1KTF6_9BACL|nr:DUF2161 family putative PD-(D/E)XK-type phosphodiesterase [Cohnella silvisoli]MCD9022959.1 hypothetical protein [Cohnella silvisoli]
MAIKLETELYPPVKTFFTGRGYEVKAEIRGCDLVAYRADQPEPTIVEMKKTFTLPLLLQGIDRQKTGAAVWLAVERNRTKRGAHNQRFTEITALCRRLNLGFLTVTFYRTKSPAIDVWCEPAGYVPPMSLAGSAIAAESPQPYHTVAGGRRKAGASKLLKEFNARSGDYNVGGSTKRKLVTAYREKAIQCALALDCHGPSSPRQVRDWTHCPTAGSMLRNNPYGWFKRLTKGVYEITPAGKTALLHYADVTKVWANQFSWAAAHPLNTSDNKPQVELTYNE